MTRFSCDRMAEDLAAYKNDYVGLDLGNEYSDVFKQDTNNKIVTCADGFDERYEHPHIPRQPQDTPGKYVSLSDLHNIFGIGISYGQAKLHGWTARWDYDFCNAIGGYPRGSILRNAKGKKMVSRYGDNNEPMPEDGESFSWAKCEPEPFFYIDDSEVPAYRTRDLMTLDIAMPAQPATFKKLATSWTQEHNEIKIFSYTFETQTLSSRIIALDICKTGNMKLKLSKFSDIYTNKKHEDSYIEVLTSNTYELPISESSTKTVRLRVPHKVVPLKAGIQYYLYLEYENGCIDSYYANYYKANLDAGVGGIVTYSSSRNLAWPRIN